jgi:hypothetical protein
VGLIKPIQDVYFTKKFQSREEIQKCRLNHHKNDWPMDQYEMILIRIWKPGQSENFFDEFEIDFFTKNKAGTNMEVTNRFFRGLLNIIFVSRSKE